MVFWSKVPLNQLRKSGLRIKNLFFPRRNMVFEVNFNSNRLVKSSKK